MALIQGRALAPKAKRAETPNSVGELPGVGGCLAICRVEPAEDAARRSTNDHELRLNCASRLAMKAATASA